MANGGDLSGALAAPFAFSLSSGSERTPRSGLPCSTAGILTPYLGCIQTLMIHLYPILRWNNTSLRDISKNRNTNTDDPFRWAYHL